MSVQVCGVWINPAGVAWLARRPSTAVSEGEMPFAPFAWCASPPRVGKVVRLAGSGAFPWMVHFDDLGAYREWLRGCGDGAESIPSLEAQFLMARGIRMFDGLSFAEVRRLQVCIATVSSKAKELPDAGRPGDRVLAIAMLPSWGVGVEMLELAEETDEAERSMLKRFGERICALDPDVVAGHRINNFDLNYLIRRCRRFRVRALWGRFGAEASFGRSRLRFAERTVDIRRANIPGRAVFDTWLGIQAWDVTHRELSSYGLRETARHLGIRAPEGTGADFADGVAELFRTERERLRSHLHECLRTAQELTGMLLPTYFAQCRDFPMTLQEIVLRGSAHKVDLLMLERYYTARHSLPAYPEIRGFEGGFARSYESGVFRHVLHFDVASLYPSLLLQIGRDPAPDVLGAFIPLLRAIRKYRLAFKKRAREATDPDVSREYEARQNSYKILINSFYGYLGFPGARFGDSELAAEVTRRGRELLQSLIVAFRKRGCRVLVADTDGLYAASEEWWEAPEKLLAAVSEVLPAGIDLELAGRYESMFCYKAKNYALYDGERLTIRGSALRSRGTEPFMRELTDVLIASVLGVGATSPSDRARELRERITRQELPVEQVARSENLSDSPKAYRSEVEAGRKRQRRAAFEVALQLDPIPAAGDRVAYYIGPREKGQTADWQRARPVSQYHELTAPYDPAYYLKRIDEWERRYGAFL